MNAEPAPGEEECFAARKSSPVTSSADAGNTRNCDVGLMSVAGKPMQSGRLRIPGLAITLSASAFRWSALTFEGGIRCFYPMTSFEAVPVSD
jgi:hypothetical protein